MREDEVKQLREQRMQKVTELRTFNDDAQKRRLENNGVMLAEDEQELDKRSKEIIEDGKALEHEYRVRQLVASNPEEHVRVDQNGGAVTLEEYRKANMARRPLPGIDSSQADIDTPESRAATYKWLVHGREGLDYDEYRVLSKGASGGGFFVPTDLADQIVRALRFLPGGVTSLARTITTSGGETINIPRNLTHGTAAWIAESGSYTPSDETITNGTISAFKAGTKIIVSEELLTDSDFDLTSLITTEFGERIGSLAEDAYINGDGTGKPEGMLVAGAAISAATLPAGYVTTIAYTGIAAALMAVPAQYRANSSILLADSFFIKLVTLADSTGRPVWNPSMASSEPDRVLGIPVFTHPNLPAVGANSESGIVGDFSRGYLIRRVNGVFMQRQNELHSDSGQVGFRAYLRLDGRTQLADALRIITFAAT